MTSRISGSLRIWHLRNPRARGDHAYLAYMIVMLTLVAVAPLVRAISVSLTSAEGIALLTSQEAPSVATLAISSIWAFCLLLGRARGPALRPPVVTHALASSDIPRATSFMGPLLRSGMALVALTTIVGVLIGAGLVSAGRCEPGDALLFVLACACVGIISAVVWLAGQAMPRTAAVLAPVVFALGTLTSTLPAMQTFTPWGWAGLTYPVASATGTLAPLLAATAAAVTVAPALMDRLTLTRLIAQATRWEAAASHTTGMDLAAAATVYQPAPKVGRRLRAVRPALRRPLLFLLRDAVGAARTPIRLAAATVALAVAAVLFTLSFGPASPSWILSAVAGVILFAGLGPLTDGIRHAASIAADLPLYGISDERLLGYHAIFPIMVTTIVVLVASTISSFLVDHAIAAILGALALGILAVIARVGNALKGPLPPALLTPIPTPMGDFAAVGRLAWATDGVILTASAGAAAALAFRSPLLLAAVSVALTSLTIHRWRRRF